MDKREKYPLCPVDDLFCPYYDIDSNQCLMYKIEKCTPYAECDAFYGIDDE